MSRPSSAILAFIFFGLGSSVFLPALPVHAQAPEAAPAFTIGAGEIQFSGQIEAADFAAGTFTLSVRAFTLPSGKTSQLAAPKAKIVGLDASTVIQSPDGKQKVAQAALKSGAEVLVIGKDLGTGKPLPARLVVVAPGPTRAQRTALPEKEIRAGELRLDGTIDGILATNSFMHSVTSITPPSGKARELEERESWNVLLDDKTTIRAQDEAGRKYTAADLKLGLRMSVVGRPLGADKSFRAREVVLQESANFSSRSVGSNSIDAKVAQLARQSDEFRKQKLYTEALKVLDQAVQRAQLVGDRTGEAMMLNRQGNLYQMAGQPARGLKSFQEALEIWRQLGNRGSEATTLNNLGVFYLHAKDPKKALETLLQAVPLQQDGTPEAQVMTWINLGTVYADVEESQKALDAFQRALPLLHQIGDKERGAEVRSDMVSLYLDLEDTEKALQMAEQTVPLLDAIREKPQLALTLKAIGTAYRIAGKPQPALKYLRQAVELFGELGLVKLQASVQRDINKIEHPEARQPADKPE